MIQLARKGGLGNTFDEVLSQPARVVYMTLLVDFEESEYTKALNKIYARRSK